MSENPEIPEGAAQEPSPEEYKPMSYEQMMVELENQPWPPNVQYKEGDEPKTITELDVSWVFCTVLGMKWADAQKVEGIERQNLYAKAMQVSRMLEEQAFMAHKEKESMREAFQKKLDTFKGDKVPEDAEVSFTSPPPAEPPSLSL